MMVKFHSANRDETVFPDPTPLRSTGRTSNLKLPSAKGAPLPRAPLARQELMVGFKVILERMTNFGLPKGQEELEFLPSLLLHPPAKLSITFDKRQPA